MSTKSKITLLLVLTSLIGAVVFGLLSYLDSRESLQDAAFDELTAIRTARAAQVEDYFDSVFDEASVVTENPTVRRALAQFRAGFAELEADADTPEELESLERYYDRRVLPVFDNLLQGDAVAESFVPKSRAGRHLQNLYLVKNPNRPADYVELADTGGGSLYERTHASFHDDLRYIRDEFGYYDIFLIDVATGDIVYSVRKEPDFATNIYDGPYRGSDLANLVEEVVADPSRRAVHITDIEFYLASEGKPAFFVGSSIYEGDRVTGVLAIQLTLDDLNAIMTSRGDWAGTGLKSSGETYLVGQTGTLLNESRFFVEDRENYLAALREAEVPEATVAEIARRNSSILLQPTDTEATREAFLGRSDTRVVEDYRGEPVLSAYAPLRVDDQSFAIVAEIDEREAFAPVRDLARRMAVTSAVVIPLTALFGIWAAGLLMSPARRMEATADAFLGGDEDVRFDADRPDEWGHLGRRLNRVLDAARQRLADAGQARGEVKAMVSRLMPFAIGDRYAQGETDIVSHAADATAATILLSPSVEFGDTSDPKRAAKLYEALDDALDAIATENGVDLLNQAGMHYVAFCGLTTPIRNHAERVYRFCAAARDTLAAFDNERGTTVGARFGLDTGPMLGALVGTTSAAYEIWGPVTATSDTLAHGSPLGGLMASARTADEIGAELGGKAVEVTTLSGAKLQAVRVETFL